ncbi:MAG: carboxymuconolactone decarboxylase family protein, partial [Gemmatimonadota bacterium]|nr:carboxymuconolactone decarboxylase family protein [Gemmatimonadota bacterium]
SLHPAAMQAHMDLYMAVMFQRSGISREERELIAVVVSAANRCAYCVSHHAAALNAYWKDQERV